MQPVSGTPSFATMGNEPLGVAWTPDGNYLVVANFASSDISVMKNDPTSFLLTVVNAPTATDTNPIAVAIDGSSSFLWVVNQGADLVTTYKLDGNGVLTLQSKKMTGHVRQFAVLAR